MTTNTTTATPVVHFPGVKPRLVTLPLLDPSGAVERFDVVTPWVRIAVPVKAAVGTTFATLWGRSNQGLGQELYSSSLRFVWPAEEGRRESELEQLLLRAEFMVCPQPKSRSQKTLTLEMKSRSWETIKALAKFYDRTPVAMLQALLLFRLDHYRAFKKHQATMASTESTAVR